MRLPKGIFSAIRRRAAGHVEPCLHLAFCAAILMRLLYPFFDPPIGHLFSDPLRHWQNGIDFMRPSVMGGQDPYLYQLWLYLVQKAGLTNAAFIQLATGILCAAMPYGWYRTCKELMPRRWALAGGIIIALTPAFLGLYAYFMNETLLMPLVSFAMWLSLRAMRKGGFWPFALACLFWLLAGFSRSVALPMGLVVLGYLWLFQSGKIARAAVGIVILAALAIPSGLHARQAIHFFAPFGNFYMNDIYRQSGKRYIFIDFVEEGHYQFLSPSFTGPVYYPWLNRSSNRASKIRIHIDTSNGRADWIREKARAVAENDYPPLEDFFDNFLYLTLGQSWPDNDPTDFAGKLTMETRLIWPALMVLIAAAALARRFRGREWLIPGLGLGMFVFICLQQSAVCEGRFRKPIDPFFVVSALIAARSFRKAAPSSPDHALLPQA